MKRILCLILCLILMPCVAAAESAPPDPLPDWIELSADDAVLTVRVPLDDAQNQSCRFLIPDERMLELLTCEVIGDEEGEAGEGLWVGSFISAFQKSGYAFLQLAVEDSVGKLLSARTLWLSVREDNSLEIVSFEESSRFFLTQDQCGLNVRLESNPTTGYQWSYALSDEDFLRCDAEEYIADPAQAVGSGGVWSARFASTGNKAGFVELHLRYARPWEEDAPAKEHTLHLFVNESGLIQPIFAPPQEPAPIG